MDEEGNIEVEESDDEYSNDKDDTEKLLVEDDYKIFEPSKKRKKSKMFVDQRNKPQKKSKFECDVCKSCFTRKDNLARHIKNKH